MIWADGAEFPWAEDLDHVWHCRPEDADWNPAPEATQTLTRCGLAIASVNVSTNHPATADDWPHAGERVCARCDALWAAAKQAERTDQ